MDGERPEDFASRLDGIEQRQQELLSHLNRLFSSDERIRGDYTGTTFKDFLVLPGYTEGECTPETVDIQTELAGVKLSKPFLPAAMRTVVGKEMALEASRNGMLPVAPRGLPVEEEVEIVQYVKGLEVKPGEIETRDKPVYLFDDATLGQAIKKTREFGHSNIPVKNEITAEFMGMFTYQPAIHDFNPANTPIKEVMTSYRNPAGSAIMKVVKEGTSNNDIKRYMTDEGLRLVPVLDDQDRMRSLVFMQQVEAYKIGAAIDTRPGWQERTKELIDAGTDMIFIDTSDAHSDFTKNIILEYNGKLGEVEEVLRTYNGDDHEVPICAGNIVTAEAFRTLAEAGADVVKVGMGSGSICTTNTVLAVGAPPFWALVDIAKERDLYYKETGRYIPIIADGGIEDTWDINVVFAYADAMMGGRTFAGFHESAGEKIEIKDKFYKVYRGEGSPEAREAAGNRGRYHMGEKHDEAGLYQGIEGLVPLQGYMKPGVELYSEGLRTAMTHVGAYSMQEYRNKSRLIRISEEAKKTAHPHGLLLSNAA